jgi:hypothetical protein
MSGEDMARFSDTELTALRADFDAYKDEQDAKFDRLIAMVESNNRATGELAAATQDIVRVYTDWQGTIRIGAAVQRCCLWLGKWGVIGAGMAAGIKYVLSLFPPGP